MYFIGDKDIMFFLVKKNIEWFESYLDEVDVIIVFEVICVSMFINDYYKVFLGEKDKDLYVKRLEKIMFKIYLVSVFLEKYIFLKSFLEKIFKGKKEVIIYYNFCYVKKILNVYKEVCNLFNVYYEIKEMLDNCCGFGGIMM